MPPEDPSPGSSDAWLRLARSDLALAAVTPPPETLLETLCFHAQQAAEKALKGVLVAHSVSPPRTHSIGTLLDLIDDTVTVPAEIQEAALLTDYAVSTRYPGDVEPVETEEYQQALRLAQSVVSWAESLLG